MKQTMLYLKSMMDIEKLGRLPAYIYIYIYKYIYSLFYEFSGGNKKEIGKLGDD
jgi:hypothetical protein